MLFSVGFVLSGRVLFAPAAQRGLCPHALRAPLQGLLALDLGKGLTPPLASGVDVLQIAFPFFSLAVILHFLNHAERSDRINAA